MARIRSVHPSLFTDEAWVSCSPLARVLFIGLWTDADDQGLFEWKPLQLKMRLLPGDGADVTALLAELADVDLVKAYDVDGKRYGAIKDFRKFQRPQKPNAIHPLPEIIREYVGLAASNPTPVADQSRTGTGKSPQMEDGEEDVEDTTVTNVPVVAPTPAPKRERRATRRCPEGFQPSEGDIRVGLELGMTEEAIAAELPAFLDYTFRTARSDWSATFRNWLRTAAQRNTTAPRARHDRPYRSDRAEQRDVWADILAESDPAYAGGSEPLRITGGLHEGA